MDYNLEITLIQANLRNLSIKNSNKLLFIGDSITDTSRSRPIGQANYSDPNVYSSTGLGNGYVSIVDSLLITSHPELHLTLLNQGKNGNRVIDLEKRWQQDVIELSPDWLIILIGINDVWRQFDQPKNPNQVLIKRFEKVYRSMIDKQSVCSSNIVLMSPYYLETNREDPMRKKMIEYAATVEILASECQCSFVNLQDAFDRYLTFRTADSISSDKIHLNKVGHTIIAQSFLNVIADRLPK